MRENDPVSVNTAMRKHKRLPRKLNNKSKPFASKPSAKPVAVHKQNNANIGHLNNVENRYNFDLRLSNYRSTVRKPIKQSNVR